MKEIMWYEKISGFRFIDSFLQIYNAGDSEDATCFPVDDEYSGWCCMASVLSLQTDEDQQKKCENYSLGNSGKLPPSVLFGSSGSS